MSPIVTAALVAAAVASPSDTPRFAQVRLSTGVRIHYAEQGPSSAEPIILLHGYSDSWFSFSRVIPLLARDARVYALDLRGHGKSEQPATGYRMRDLAADVVAFMDAKQIVRATVIGHSMGGFVAQQVALAAPRRVSRLVLVGTATTVRNMPGVDELAQAVNGLTDPVPEAFVREFQLSTVHAPVGDEFMNRVVSESLRLPTRVWRALLAGMLDADRAVAIGRSGIPALVLRGEKDAYITPAETDSLSAMVRASRRRTYADVGHSPHWEQPAEFAKDVRAFLAETRPANR
jgi:pimeloyl-ACP methyl ester carboxylesterase